MGVKLIECIFRRQGSLGLTLVEDTSHIIIKDFEGQAKELKSIKKGDRIVKIGNRDVQRCTLKDILGILRKSRKRPLVIIISRIVHGLGTSNASWSSTSAVVEVVRAPSLEQNNIPPPPPPKKFRGIHTGTKSLQNMTKSPSQSTSSVASRIAKYSSSSSNNITNGSRSTSTWTSRNNKSHGNNGNYGNSFSSPKISNATGGLQSTGKSYNSYVKNKAVSKSAVPKVKKWSSPGSTQQQSNRSVVDHSHNATAGLRSTGKSYQSYINKKAVSKPVPKVGKWSSTQQSNRSVVDHSPNATAGLRSTGKSYHSYVKKKAVSKPVPKVGKWSSSQQSNRSVVDHSHNATAGLHRTTKSVVTINYRALFDFEGEEADELSFKKGQIIKFLTKVDGNWNKGKLNGKEGIFPSDYAEPI